MVNYACLTVHCAEKVLTIHTISHVVCHSSLSGFQTNMTNHGCFLVSKLFGTLH
jgi:hypothetical protein